ASPRRVALLARLGIVPDVVDPAHCDETPIKGELPRDYARRMAHEKVDTVAPRHPGAVVLAADTVVAAGRRILPKTEDADQARSCLNLLSGRRHRVFSAIVLIDAQGRVHQRLSETILAFKRLTEAEIATYIAREEWRGKAGGYAIQGSAESWVRFLGGSHSGVIGLPLYETRALLVTSGILECD
ncbi:MAG: septum formation protein Maf, partial [Alphaproteobacteria bacterium]|nr:septum formation protein Maf [Alphaproteobacteria bacterium]